MVIELTLEDYISNHTYSSNSNKEDKLKILLKLIQNKRKNIGEYDLIHLTNWQLDLIDSLSENMVKYLKALNNLIENGFLSSLTGLSQKELKDNLYRSIELEFSLFTGDTNVNYSYIHPYIPTYPTNATILLDLLDLTNHDIDV